MAWSSAKPIVAPAVTSAVPVDAPESSPPALQRISLEVTEVTGEFALVFWRTYSYGADAAPSTIKEVQRSGDVRMDAAETK